MSLFEQIILDKLGIFGYIIIILMLAYSVLSFIVPFYVISINNKLKKQAIEIQELRDDIDRIGEFLLLFQQQYSRDKSKS